MAELFGKNEQKTPFSGGANTITFPLYSTSRSGFQLSVEGFNCEDAVIEVKPYLSDDWVTVDIPDGSGAAVILSDGFRVDSVRVGGLPAGDYYITVLQ